MKNELHITEFGLIKEFILLRDQVVRDYRRNKLDTFSTTHSHSNPQSYTQEEREDSGSTQKIYRALLKEIQSNTNTKSNTNIRDTFQKQLKAIDDERETSPLLTETTCDCTDSTTTHDREYHLDDQYDELVITVTEFTDDDDDDDDGGTNMTNISTESNCNTTRVMNDERLLAAYEHGHGWKLGLPNDIKYNLKWRKIATIENTFARGENDNNYFMKQYEDVSYNGGCKLVIDGCIHALCLLANMKYCSASIHGISSLTFEYLYEEEKSVYQFAFDIWKILYKMNRRHVVEGEAIKSFVGDALVVEMRRQYWNKYRFDDICLYCNDLLKYGYIEWIARRDHAEATTNRDLYMNDDKSLYRMVKAKKRQFKKYHHFMQNKLDRDSWCRGTQVEIYSTSLRGWQVGEIVKIGANRGDTVVVSYGGGTDSKYLLKTVKRYDVELVRSTWDYVTKRNEWEVGTEIEIFSNSDEHWYKARIEEVVARDSESQVIDAFRVKYVKEDVHYTKVVEQWSSDCRDVQVIANQMLIRYKGAKQCKVWMEGTKSWDVYYVKDIIPKHQYVVVQNVYQQYATERIIDINSGFIRPMQ
eukprot:486825_1